MLKLYRLARLAEHAGTRPDPHILEVGNWVGRSLVPLAANCRHGKVVGVDIGQKLNLHQLLERHPDLLDYMDGNPDVWNLWDKTVREVLNDVIAHHGLSNVEVVLSTSKKFFAANERTFDLIYVDGSHETDEVYEDLTSALQVLRPGGMVCGDDYSHWASVRAAVDACVVNTGYSLYADHTTNFFALYRDRDLVTWLPELA